ncbi:MULTISPECIES: hypothetical protein [unclassified Tolypothrix]|nr:MULTISPECIES: hypothetical protein [unclassified Tolypothrix]EKE99963.1 hypothetical protein FDUTEX481_09486 [Tolypothrix sp. PCC 7601]BAY91113.1 hypothetical protein NIES3275_31350 [Microchaete diplosiphon NIES-3275]
MKIPFLPQRRTVLKRMVQYTLAGVFALSAPLTVKTKAEAQICS